MSPRARVLALAALGVLASVRLASGQCPDGTPPPCAGRRPAAHLPSVAVLFMEPRSRNGDDSLLAEGLTLEIITTLGGVQRLDVRSRWVSRHVAADTDPMRGARALGVDYLVDGVLEVDSARVLVRGGLTRTSTGRVVRPLRIERRRTELGRLQADLAAEVASAVVGQLLPAERARFAVRREDPRVTELLLRAGALIDQYTAAGFRQALVLVRQALALDSSSSRAWAALAICRWRGFGFDGDPDSGGAAVARALALDSSSGLALALAAEVRARLNDLSPATEAMARRGAGREPGTSTGLSLLYVLVARGHIDEAVAVARDVVRRDSLSPVAWVVSAYRLRNARRFTEAAHALERALALRPSPRDSVWLVVTRRWVRLEHGDCAGALAEGRASADTSLLIESLHCLGRAAEADSIVDARLASAAIALYERAILLGWRGRPDSAFALLDRTFPPALGIGLLEPAFAPYRGHPAYLALHRRLGLDQ